MSRNAPPSIKNPARIYAIDGDSPKIMMDSNTPASGAVPYRALVRAAPNPRMERINRMVLIP